MVPGRKETGHHQYNANDQKLLRGVRSLIRILCFLLGSATGFLLCLDRFRHLLYLISRSTLAVGVSLKVRVIAASFHLCQPRRLYGDSGPIRACGIERRDHLFEYFELIVIHRRLISGGRSFVQ